MSIKAIIAQERRNLLSDKAQFVLLAAFLVVCLYAVWIGAHHRSSVETTTQAFLEAGIADADAWRERIVDIESGAVAPEDDIFAGSAMGVYLPAVSGPGPLSDLSIGVTDLQPMTAMVSQWRTVERLFGSYQFQSPAAIASGPFDMAFVVIFVLPLLMIALAYDVLAEDRERGRLGLVLSQPISVRDLVFARLRVRLGAVLIILLLALAVGFFVGASEAGAAQRAGRFAIWVAIAVAYFAFWFMTIAWAVSLNRKGETTVLLLAAVWALNGLIGPATLAAGAEALHPAPSRLAFLSDTREASSEAYKSRADVMQGMLLDHPQLTVENYSLPEYIRTSFLVTQSVDESVSPVLESFDRVHENRHQLLSRVQYASPAIVALQTFNTVSGSSLERQKKYEREVRAFKHDLAENVEEKVLLGERLTVAEYDVLPRFLFVESSAHDVALSAMGPLTYFIGLAGLIGVSAVRNLNRLQNRIREGR